jgi:CheY-like chemotaxis protein
VLSWPPQVRHGVAKTIARRIARESPMARILLADDDAAARDLIQRALAVDGHIVTATQDGAEALERLQSEPGFDLLIADVQMPAVDGIALAEKGLKLHPELRVILISGFADEIGRAKHLKSKVARVVAKPVTLEQMRASVKAALGQD